MNNAREAELVPEINHMEQGSGVGADKAVQNLLAPRMLEIDLELVAFDRGDGAVAELAVEHALAERQVVAALVAKDYRRGLRFDGRA